MNQPMKAPYELLGGDAGVRRLCETLYDVMDELPEAARIRAMHKGDLGEIKQKLYEYLSGWLGGPQLYAEKYGGVCMSGPHMPYAIGPDERDQWLLCMNAALERVGASDEVKQMLKEPLFHVADAIRNRDTSDPSAQDPDLIATG